MPEIRKIAAILVADVVGYSRLAGADEDRTLARLRGLRSDLIDPAIAAHHGRVVKRTGDGSIIEFRSVVDAVRCAIEIQTGLIDRNVGVPSEKRIEFRVGIHVGDVVEESDGDLMGDGVNIAARLEGIAKPGDVCLSEDAYRQVKGRLDLKVSDLGPIQLKNIADPIRVYALQVGVPAQARPTSQASPAEQSGPPRLSMVVLPLANIGGDPEQEYIFRRRRNREPDHRPLAHGRNAGDWAQHRLYVQRQGGRSQAGRPRVERPLYSGGKRPARRRSDAR
jgi:adenylate cyclase